MSQEEFGGSCYYLSPLKSYEMEKVEGEVEVIGADSIRRSKEMYESVIGIHHYTIQGYSLAKGMGPGKYVTSDAFTVGGYQWAVYFYPDGKNVEDNSFYVSLFISLVSEGTDVRALFGLTLVDQTGKGNHKVHSLFDRALEVGPCTLKHRGSMWGYNRFSRRTSLSDYLKDDCIVMQCTIGVVKDHLHSALIRNNKFGVKAFKCANGYAALRHALRSDDARFQRKALNLIEYLIQENRSDSNTQTELGFPRLMVHLSASDDFSVREAALGALLELARDVTLGDGSGSLVKEAKLKQFLQNRINNLSSMGAEDLAATREERQLLDSLWSTCYNEPSLLREKGLIVLPGEENVEEPPPDVAGNLFEPPLRAWAANNPT